MSTTNGNVSTATVETLTAAVRVLMIGSRQITLSVVKQLDRVRYDELDPMGRVRSSRRDDIVSHDESKIEVVGCHRETGELVFAYAPQGVWPNPPSEWTHWALHMQEDMKSDPNFQPRRFFNPHSVNTIHTSIAGDYTIAITDNGKSLTWPVNGREDCCPQWGKCPIKSWSTQEELALMRSWSESQKRGDMCRLGELAGTWAVIANKNTDRYNSTERIKAEAEALPLIVLAGLK